MPDVFASVCRLATLKSFVLVLVMLGAIEAFAEQSQSIADVTARDSHPRLVSVCSKCMREVRLMMSD